MNSPDGISLTFLTLAAVMTAADGLKLGPAR